MSEQSELEKWIDDKDILLGGGRTSRTSSYNLGIKEGALKLLAVAEEWKKTQKTQTGFPLYAVNLIQYLKEWCGGK